REGETGYDLANGVHHRYRPRTTPADVRLPGAFLSAQVGATIRSGDGLCAHRPTPHRFVTRRHWSDRALFLRGLWHRVCATVWEILVSALPTALPFRKPSPVPVEGLVGMLRG